MTINNKKQYNHFLSRVTLIRIYFTVRNIHEVDPLQCHNHVKGTIDASLADGTMAHCNIKLMREKIKIIIQVQSNSRIINR